MKFLAPVIVVLCASVLLDAQQLVIRDVSVIPMSSDTMLDHRTVIIDRDTITGVVAFAPADRFPEAQVIEGTGRVLMPGLVEMHAHLPIGRASQPSMRSYFMLQLAAGVTGLRSMRGRPEHRGLRDSIRNGELLAPDLFISRILPYDDSTLDAPKLRAFVRSTKAEQWDLIKYLGGISRSLCDSAVVICREEGVPLAGHALNGDLRRSVDARFASIEHYSPFVRAFQKDSAAYEGAIADMIAGSIAMCPTLEWYYVNTDQLQRDALQTLAGMQRVSGRLDSVWNAERNETERANAADSAKVQERIASAGRDLATFRRLLKRFVDAGGRLLCGVDPDPFLVPGFAIVEELKQFRAAGLTPFQVLRSATTEPAAFFNLLSKVGTVEVGKRANLILLRRNPLENIENLATVEGTIIRGHWYTQKELLSLADRADVR